jgi:hypothetical protein
MSLGLIFFSDGNESSAVLVKEAPPPKGPPARWMSQGYYRRDAGKIEGWRYAVFVLADHV